MERRGYFGLWQPEGRNGASMSHGARMDKDDQNIAKTRRFVCKHERSGDNFNDRTELVSKGQKWFLPF